MTSVTVNSDQAQAMMKSGELVEVRNQSGEVIGFFAPYKVEYAQEYAELAARAYAAYRDGRRPLTSAEVAAHLKSLEENQ